VNKNRQLVIPAVAVGVVLIVIATTGRSPSAE
jgi:hypothetical protein